MAKAMVVSVGGTSQPIVRSICKHKPDFVSFFASQETIDLVAQIRKEVTTNGIPIKSEMSVADNVNDLVHCHEKAEEAVRRVILKGYPKDNIMIDYTGGTKNMSVALSLAAITHGFLFSYVGGDKRTKNGVGIVEDGHEEVYTNINPWDLLAVDEKRRIALLFNQCQYKAAKDLTDELVEKGTKNKSLFRKISHMIDGFYKWDLFRHNEAADCFKKAKIEDIAEYEDKTFVAFAYETNTKLIPYLHNLADHKNELTLNHILDLFSNANRRFKEGKIDDAILRLYRLVEMIAQERLRNKYNIDASNVLVENIPEVIRDEYKRLYKTPRDGKIKVPQAAAFRLLKHLNDDLGRTFYKHEKKFQNIQSARNNSYLAHGTWSARAKTFVDLKDFVLSLGMFSEEDTPVFPTLSI